MPLAEEFIEVKTLRRLGDAHVRKLAAIARPQECPAGALLFREGDDSTLIFVLLSGEVSLEVRIQDQSPTTIYMASPGELLGWSPVLGHHAMTASARATTPCRLAILEAARVNELIDQDPQLGLAFLRQLAVIVSDRLSATRHCLASVQVPFDSPRFKLLREGSD
jgi:CRP-like cAMP-binding protein